MLLRPARVMLGELLAQRVELRGDLGEALGVAHTNRRLALENAAFGGELSHLAFNGFQLHGRGMLR
ncbi:hypothetical protein SDC9_176989 [bioreactor metagenome]|uniref:Uncharacterized protein n=1 Tax=bioreactor metagenome TaxID=1076179 RepID=A0A645GTH9_9ZZZZ